MRESGRRWGTQLGGLAGKGHLAVDGGLGR